MYFARLVWFTSRGNYADVYVIMCVSVYHDSDFRLGLIGLGV